MTQAVVTSKPPMASPVGLRRARRNWRGWLFIGPFLIVFLAVLVAPIVYAIYLSLFRDQLIGGNAFVGVDNYIQAVGDAHLWGGFLRVLLFLVIQVPIMLGLALVAALALDSARLYWSPFFRIALFLPYAVPGVVAALIWGFIYGPRFGIAGSINDFLGIDVLQPFSPSWVLTAIGNVNTWEYMGYNMLIFYSALRVVSTDLYEAADLDGAGPFRVITAIKLPALRGAIVIATVFSIIGSFQLFNEPNLLRALAPNAIGTDFTPNMYAYNLSFAGQQFNYSATIAIIMGLLTAVIAYVVQVRGSRAELR